MNTRKLAERNIFHLPDFCSGNMTLTVVLIVELVALLLTTARASLHNNFLISRAVRFFCYGKVWSLPQYYASFAID